MEDANSSHPAKKAALAAADPAAPLRKRNTQRRAEEAKGNSVHKFEDVALFLQKNEFIRGHYRGSGLTLRQVFRSLFQVHNESGNIYSHLFGCLLFICLTVWLVRAPPTPLAYGAHHLWDTAVGVRSALSGGGPLVRLRHGAADTALDGLLLPGRAAALAAHQAALQDRWVPVHEPLSGALHWPAPRWPIHCYTAAAALCLAMSAACHLFYCCTPRLNSWIWRLDYVGIAGLIVSSFYPQVFYAFMCSPAWRATYLAITTVLGVAAVAVSLPARFQVPDYRRMRAGVFAGLGLWGIVPMTHMWLSFAHIHALRTALLLDLAMAAIYLGGATIYAMRIPERWRPGAFDIIFPSHQIFHLCVVAGAYVHYRSVLLLLAWRDASGGCATPLLGSLLTSPTHL